ncbi:leptin receptor isoform X2 [Pristis pectinata]|uniref:leptin receptor isoform X2 n=1 Tax=Pristis pectinata TaxID=685728 RepID=UPI00223E6E85|nr:leptin receptor isoform X2 [Pristis pectinata]
MMLLQLVTAALCLGVSVSVYAHGPEKAFEIPPWNFTMFCTLQKQGATEKHRNWQPQPHRNSSSLHSSLSEHMRNANTSRSKDQDGFSCCLWKEAGVHCPAQFINREKSIRMDIKCWATEDLTLFICTLNPEDWKMNEFAKYRIKHQDQLLLDQKESNISTYVSNCVEQHVIKCTIPSPDLNRKYFIWIELITNSGTLQSPLMFVTPINVVKVNPPLNLQTEMTVEGIFNLSWSSPNPEPYLLQFEVKYSTGNPERVWKVKDIWQNSLILHNLESGLSYLIVIRCKRRDGPGFWSDWSDPLHVNVQEITYYPSQVLTTVGSDVTVRCIFYNQTLTNYNVAWWLNMNEKIPEDNYALISDHETSVTLLNVTSNGRSGFNILQCCLQDEERSICNFRYAEIIIIDTKINISCETDGALETMICRWHSNLWKPEAVSNYKLKYYMKESWCDSLEVENNSTDVEECQMQKNEFGQCHIKPINLIFGHVMWVEFSLQETAFKSAPTCVIPMDVVKPWAPSNVVAEITSDGGDLNISWEKPLLPPYTLLFEIQYSEDGIESNWKTLFAVNETFVITEVADPCAMYVARVRCMRFEGPGYQSEWSSLVNTNLADIQAPTTGPDFWRFIDSDPLTKQSNITLIWKPLTKGEALCSVKGFTLKYQSKENITWLEHVGDVTSYSFPLTNEIKSVSVIAFNSIGSSRRNFKLILSKDSSKEPVLHSLQASVINSSCVVVSWRVLPLNCQPTSFVIEWKSLTNSDAENLKWMRASENITCVYIHDHFYPSVQYQLTVYPIFSAKEGQPISLCMKIKSEGEVTRANNDGMQNIILPLVFLSSVLLIGIFLISKQRIRSLVWKDVPNPNKCSWAQGINFKKSDAAANVFGKHSQGVFPVAPHLMESEIFAAAIIEEIIQFNEDKGVIATDPVGEVVMKQNANTSNIQVLCESNNLDGKMEGDMETTCAQSNSEYSKILIDVEMDPLCIKHKCINNYSDEGVYSGNETDNSGNESNNLWEFQKHTLMQLIQFDETKSNSIISSEGFSESQEQESKVLFNGNDEGVDSCYLEQTSFENIANSDTEGHTVQELSLLEKCLSLEFQNPSEIYSISYLDSLLKFSLNGDYPPQRTLRSYMPQFQTDF